MQKEKDLDQRTATFKATQLGIDAADAVRVSNAKETLKSQITLSQLGTLKLLLDIQNGIKQRPTSYIPKISNVPSIYAGIQIHELLTITQMHHRLSILREKKDTEVIGKTPDIYRPYLPDHEAIKVLQHIYAQALPEELERMQNGQDVPLYFLQSLFSFQEWLLIQDFTVKTRPEIYRESGLFNKGVRERIWYGKKKYGAELNEKVNLVLSNMYLQMAQDRWIGENPYTTDAIYETPMQLQVYTQDKKVRTLTWVQPDQSILMDDGTIIVRDVKPAAELARIATYDEWDWLELLLSAVAGRLLVETCLLSPRIRNSVQQPFMKKNIRVDQLSELSEGVQVQFLIPELLDSTEGLLRVDVTPTPDQKVKAMYLYSSIIEKLGEPFFKREFYDFVSSLDMQGKGLSPKTRLDTDRAVQRLLFYAAALSPSTSR